MFSNLNYFKVFLALIFTVSFISLTGICHSQVKLIPVISNTNTTDIDNIEAQKVLNAGAIDLQTAMPFTAQFNSHSLSGFDRITLPGNRYDVSDTMILAGNPNASNNGGSAGWAMFLDLIAGPRDAYVTQMKTANTGTPAQSFTVEVFIRSGTALGGPVGSGPGSSTAGWTSIGIIPVVQGSVTQGISEVFTVPAITIPAGDTVGVALKFNVVGPRYYGTGTPAYSTYSDTNLTLVTGDARSAPFTTTGSWFSSRALNGEVRYVVSITTGIVNTGTGIPENYKLAQNYPNPFNPGTTIEFGIPKKSNVSLKIFNIRGQEVAALADGEFSAGSYSVNWNAENLASGIYFYRLNAGSFSQTKKLTLIK